MAELLSRRKLLTALVALGGGAVAAQFAKNDGDADAMLPAGGGGGGGDLSGGEAEPSPVDITFYEASTADDLTAADGAVTVVTGGDVAELHFGYKSMSEVEPQGYEVESSDYDASAIEQTPALVFVPDDGNGIGSIHWEGS